MCFSAESSITSAVLLGGITIMCANLAKSKKQQYPLVVVPLVFMLMQLVEAVTWIASTTSYAPKVFSFAAYFFFIISYVYWPLIAAIICFMLEERPKQKKVIGGIFLLGLFSAAMTLYLSLYAPAPTGRIVQHSIQYTYSVYDPYPFIVQIKGFFLLFLIGVPIAISRIPYKWLNIVFFTVSFTVAISFYDYAFVSVWCFFSTIVAVSVMASLKELNNPAFQVSP